jgi:hypothetical protein
VSVTFVAVMLRSNCDRLHEIAAIAQAYDAPLRINVYQAVRSGSYALTNDEYWRGFETLFAHTDVIAVGERLVRAMAGMPPRRSGCGVATVRVTPRATVQPCVYWPGAVRTSPAPRAVGAGNRRNRAVRRCSFRAGSLPELRLSRSLPGRLRRPQALAPDPERA